MARITAADVGHRVTVRRRTPEGSATDVVGDLTSWTDAALVVRDRDDVEHRVLRRDVIAGRVVTARPAPPRAVALERVAAAGWPATETEHLGEWLLRAAGGFTGWANSALAIGDPGVPFGEAVPAVRAWYERRGLPARAAVVLPSPEDDGFAGLGWAPSHAVLVQTAAVQTVSSAAPEKGGVEVLASPTPGWLARYTARGEVTELDRRVLTGGGAVGFAQVGAEPEAIGRGVVVDGWLGISAVEVAPHARRRGLAAAVTGALARWGAGRGAERVYLQVQSDNQAARTLYARLGFRIQHRYRYRAPAVRPAPRGAWHD